MKTVTLTEPLTFLEGIQAIEEGRALGIRPGNNQMFCMAYGNNAQGPLLKWARSNGSGDDEPAGICTQQFLGEWFLVLEDQRGA